MNLKDKTALITGGNAAIEAIARATGDAFGRAPRVASLASARQAKQEVDAQRANIVRLYREDMYDWTGHDWACQRIAERTGLPERIVRNIIANAVSIF